MLSALRTSKLLLAPVLLGLPLLASACVFGDSAKEPQATPTSTIVARPAISRTGPAPTVTPEGGIPPTATRVPPTPSAARSPVDGLVSVVYSFPFIWPASGPITSFMSPEHPNGIDIGLEDASNKEIRAAARGTVREAGGDDDQALGISVVLDHGNGVTTVYGHLSSLRVKNGDEVQIGQTIGIGGSTGISTGEHLHFEVRKDGDTVDPLHVLPVDDGDTTAFEFDCLNSPFTMPSGSEALLDFASVLRDGEEVVSASVVPLNGGPAIEESIDGDSAVRVASAINFDGPDALDSYVLEVTLDSSSENVVLDCPFVVERRDVPTTFYVRAFPPAGELEAAAEPGAEPTPEPEPTPQPTPNPYAGSPSYAVPTPAAGNGAPPSYGAPPSSGGVAQGPSYGFPSSPPPSGPTTAPPAGATAP